MSGDRFAGSHEEGHFADRHDRLDEELAVVHRACEAHGQCGASFATSALSGSFKALSLRWSIRA